MFQTDVLKTKNGKDLELTFIAHGSLAMGFEGKNIYIDPVGMFADYTPMPKADVILITHDHYDHLDKDTVDLLTKEGTSIITTKAVEEILGKGDILNNGEKMTVGDWMEVEAIPAYNIAEERQQFHPNNGRNNGYLLTLGGTRIYVSGDTEPIEEMKDLKNIDIAFLAVNQPYTMTVEQAAQAALTIKPKIFYPYHFGHGDQMTDLSGLVTSLAGSGIDLRIRDME